MFSRTKSPLSFILLLALVLAGCRGASATLPPAGVTPGQAANTAAPAGAETLIPATATLEPTLTSTPEPLAARVNGGSIRLADYQAELAQVQEAHQALGKTSTPEEQSALALNNLIDTLLLAQGAYENGFAPSDADVQAAIDQLAQQLGGAQAVQDWASRRGYDDTGFRSTLSNQIAAAWQRDQIAAAVPTEAEQIRARQIMTIDEEAANNALLYVQIPGTNFAAYAYQFDLQTGGDLGWFPRGYLTQPAVEEAAFSLQPGQISPVIKSEVGYHILQVISREPSRPLSPDARRVLQHKALQAWIDAQRAASQIEILLQ